MPGLCTTPTSGCVKRSTRRSYRAVDPDSDQTLTLIAQELLVTDNPRGKRATAGFPFLGPDPTQSRPFADGEVSLADDLSELLRCVPIAYLLALHQHGKDFLNPFQPRLGRIAPTCT